MTQTEAEKLLNKYLKRNDKNYNNIIEKICRETKGYFLFACKYRGETEMRAYGVFKHSKAVVLAPT